MARVRPPRRISELAAAAVEVFIRAGYTRAQMAEVANTLGVAKGTVYLYVESKEALFDLAVRFAAGDLVDATNEELPLLTPPLGLTMQRIEEELTVRGRMPRLIQALSTADVPDVTAEARAIFEELFATMYTNRLGIRLVDRCARDIPKLEALWYQQIRGALVVGLGAWLTRRQLPVPPTFAARFILETMAFWAVHRSWDPQPPPVGEDLVQQETVAFLLRAITKEAPRSAS